MYSSTSITEHLELFRFTLSFKKKKKKSLPTYPKFLDWVGRGQTNIFLNAALADYAIAMFLKENIRYSLFFMLRICFDLFFLNFSNVRLKSVTF